MHAIDRVNRFDFVVSGEIDQDAASVAQHRLQTRLLDMNVAAQDRSIEDIFIFDERKFRLVGTASNFLHQLRIVAAAGLFVSSVQPRLSRDISLARTRST